MPSRMERYYQTDTNDKSKTNRRTLINKDIYENIYDEVEYTNVEGIASIDKTNEIDINRIKEMLRKRDEDREFDGARSLVKRPTFKELDNDEVDLKNYDIHELLSRAKTERPEIDQSYHRLSEKQLELLNQPQVRTNVNKIEYPIKDEAELKGVIDKITSTSMLNKVGDKDLSLDVLNDLKSDTEIITTDNESIRKIINAQREGLEEENKDETVDQSFYTSGVSFKQEDFDQLKEKGDVKEESNFVVKALIFIMLVIITSGVILGLLMYFK